MRVSDERLDVMIDAAEREPQPALFSWKLAAYLDLRDARTELVELQDMYQERDEARADAKELQDLFSLQQTRMGEATKRWQDATGEHNVLPDLGELLAWLMSGWDEARAQLAACREALLEKNGQLAALFYPARNEAKKHTEPGGGTCYCNLCIRVADIEVRKLLEDAALAATEGGSHESE